MCHHFTLSIAEASYLQRIEKPKLQVRYTFGMPRLHRAEGDIIDLGEFQMEDEPLHTIDRGIILTNIFKNTVKILCVCLAMFLPLITHAQPSGEIIFQHGEEPFEIWIGNVREKRTSRRIFKRLLLPMTLAIQKGDRYILTVAERFVDDELALAFDAYLLDRQRPRATEKNLTQGKYGDILDADVSINGDVIFTNSCPNVLVACGLYFIPQHEREKLTPKAELLLQVDAGSVDWAPNGKEVAYCTKNRIFGFNLFTKTSVKYIHHGCYPVFSPDGRHIAYIHRGDRKKRKSDCSRFPAGAP